VSAGYQDIIAQLAQAADGDNWRHLQTLTCLIYALLLATTFNVKGWIVRMRACDL
jgi:hypothetical protein